MHPSRSLASSAAYSRCQANRAMPVRGELMCLRVSAKKSPPPFVLMTRSVSLCRYLRRLFLSCLVVSPCFHGQRRKLESSCAHKNIRVRTRRLLCLRMTMYIPTNLPPRIRIGSRTHARCTQDTSCVCCVRTLPSRNAASTRTLARPHIRP